MVAERKNFRRPFNVVSIKSIVQTWATWPFPPPPLPPWQTPSSSVASHLVIEISFFTIEGSIHRQGLYSLPPIPFAQGVGTSIHPKDFRRSSLAIFWERNFLLAPYDDFIDYLFSCDCKCYFLLCFRLLILPLHSTITTLEQAGVFKKPPEGFRKVNNDRYFFWYCISAKHVDTNAWDGFWFPLLIQHHSIAEILCKWIH